jgi:hypothetical protein
MLEIEIEKEKEEGAMDEYEVKHCADMVLKVEALKQEPEKWKAVMAELQKRKKALDGLTGLDKIKAKAKEKIKPEEPESY